MDKLLIISKKWASGRGQYTSIERFCSLLDPQFPACHGQRIHIPPFISRFFKNRTNSLKSASYSAPYNSYSFELELWGLKQAIQKPCRYVFFPYADYDYYYWQYFKKILGLKVILWSFFSEKEYRERFSSLHHFEQADLVLVAGRSQEAYLRSHAPRARVEFFPIGVDTDFFTPGDHFDPLRLVHVGNNRRDFATLVKGLDIVQESFPQLRVDLIGASASKHIIPERPYLTIHEHLNDHDYREILQDCNFSILSLEDGGSSNSLLETSACGLPAVVTDVPNVRDYLNENYQFYFKQGDAENLAIHCINLLKCPDIRYTISIDARLSAVEFDWNKIKCSFHNVLENGWDGY